MDGFRLGLQCGVEICNVRLVVLAMVQLHDLLGDVRFECLPGTKYERGSHEERREQILTSYGYGRADSEYCGADMASNAKGCWSEAAEVVSILVESREKRQAERESRSVPRIMAVT